MRELNAVDFTCFFKELWGEPPFAWQQRLAANVLNPADTAETWPEAIELPAASGKTACMDIAVFALAAQSYRLAENSAITAPRRIFFVVDRRVIVDQAYKRACCIRQCLHNARHGILKEVADRLRQIARGETTAFSNELPLAAYSLRGGMYRSDAWARDPLQPMIVASTVDQIGSRMLFRAYGRSNHTWPIYAGLVANDSLIFLDEAHCAQPFLQTLLSVKRYRTWATDKSINRPFYPVVMSATPPPNLRTFKDISEERRDPHHPLGKRQLAHKPATLEKTSLANGEDIASELVHAMCKAALGLTDDGLRAIVVFSNRVAIARDVYKYLNRQNCNIETALLTGRMRPVDKEAVVKRLEELCLHSKQSSMRNLDKPVIVVATQTLEVGADLDFDGLVTECASLDALRQRFGRLNRIGRNIDSRAVILIRSDQAKPKKGNRTDPVYGAALANTWKWLNERKDENGKVDFGIAYLDQTLSHEDSMSLNAPSLDAPIMLPAHIDCWGQTEPIPDPSPDVSLFLHGPTRASPEVRVCWRAGLDLTNKKAEALELLRLCPPSSSETLPVPIGILKRWLANRSEVDDSSDVEGVCVDTDQYHETAPEKLNVIRWNKVMERTEDHVISDPKKIKPWDVIVIPTSTTQTFEQLGDLPQDATGAALDVGDRAYRLARAKPILHLHTELVKHWPHDIVAKDAALSLLGGLEQKHEEDVVADELHDILVKLKQYDPPQSGKYGLLQDTARELLREYAKPESIRTAYHIIGNSHLLIVGCRRLKHLTQESEAFNDEDDDSSSGISQRNGHPVRLVNHHLGVEEFARRYAIGCGLPNQLVEAVTCAGSLHDVGKTDPRFQLMILGGKLNSNEYYAKSAKYPKTRAAKKAARENAGYPEGRPHPLLSVRLAESAPNALPKNENQRNLVLHLIASHHGQCRPFAPRICDEQPILVEYKIKSHHMKWSGPTGLEHLNSGIADRYWMLVRRYGWWGLAWLEALVRLADWQRSEWEETHDD